MKEEKIVTIDRLSLGGDGVGRIDGKVVFVPWTAPGDTVRIRLTEEHQRFDRGQVVEVVSPSADRVQPRCSVLGLCGGCQWQHIPYATQVRTKEAILRETLEKIGRVGPVEILPIITSSDPWGYRNRIQIRKSPDGKIGFLESGSHNVVEFENCDIVDPLLNGAVKRLKSNGRKMPKVAEVVVEGGEVFLQSLEDPERIFLQVNPVINQRLIEVVMEFTFGRADPAFTRRQTVVELYSGNGNLTLPLAERAGKVIAVEVSASAVKEAEQKALEKYLQIEFICGSTEWGLKKILRHRLSVDTLVLDPPRRGAKEILDLICVMKPRQIIYVSCDPSTLARDLKVLVERHFQLETIQPLDMFPQTYHIESVAKLVRKNGG